MLSSTPTSLRPPQPKQILLIGTPGAGKSTLSMQFPNPYFIDADLNLEGPERRLRKMFPSLEYRYDAVSIDDALAEVPEGDRFQRLVRLSDKARLDPWVKTIIDDSLTNISQFLIWEIMAKQAIQQLRPQDWGAHTGGMYSLLIKQKMIGKTIIMTCHREDKKKKVDKTLEEVVIGYLPAIRPGIQETLGGFFTDIWHVTLEPKPGDVFENRIRTMPTTMMPYLKNSMGMPADMPATWAEIKKYWTGPI